jgi:hypothetical protein
MGLARTALLPALLAAPLERVDTVPSSTLVIRQDFLFSDILDDAADNEQIAGFSYSSYPSENVVISVKRGPIIMYPITVIESMPIIDYEDTNRISRILGHSCIIPSLTCHAMTATPSDANGLIVVDSHRIMRVSYDWNIGGFWLADRRHIRQTERGSGQRRVAVPDGGL